MKLRWLGNSCVEIIEPRHFLFDPNFLIEPFSGVEMIFTTHEHVDHFDLQCYKKINAPLVAPFSVLNDYKIIGIKATPGETIEDVKILENWCWKAKESVSYYFNGILHTGDSSKFPQIDKVKIVFTACFPSLFEEYLMELRKLSPELVIPFHYNQEKIQDAIDLVEFLQENDINAKIVKVGEIIEY